MASIHRDPRFPKGVWYCNYTLADGRRVFRSTGKRERKAAQIICQALQQAEDEARGGSLSKDRLQALFNETLTRIGESPSKRITVKDWLESWLAAKALNVSPTSFRVYTRAVREFLAYLGDRGQSRSLESISERDIEGFTARLLAEGRSNRTVNNLVRRFLSGAFEKARRTGKIQYNPVGGTTALKDDSGRKATFTAEQIAAILQQAPDDWKGAILFSYGTGARLGDTANLKWSNLDVANGIVIFQQKKTGSQAVIGLHPDFLDWLATRPAPDDPNGPVFPSLAAKPVEGRFGLSATFVGLLD